MNQELERGEMDDDLRHWAARAVNFFCTLLGIWMATGRFLPAITIAVVSTVLAIVGYAWVVLQSFGAAALILGILRAFGAVAI
jgi:hypothetical protein